MRTGIEVLRFWSPATKHWPVATAIGFGLALLLADAVAVAAEPFPQIPLKPDTVYADGCELAPLWSSAGAAEGQEKFDCGIGIYKDELIISASSDRPLTDKPVASPLKTESFAVFLDVAGSLRGFHMICADFKGQFKLFYYYAAGGNEELPLKIEPKIESLPGLNKILMRIPLSALRVSPGQGDIWGVHGWLWRLDKDDKTQVLQRGRYRPQLRDLAWLSAPRHFDPFVVGKDPPGISLTRGNLAAEEIFSDNRFTWTYLKPAAKGKATLSVLYSEKPEGTAETVGSANFTYLPDNPVAVNCAYHCPGNEGSIEFLIKTETGETLYRSRYGLLGNPKSALDFRPGAFDDERVEWRPDPRLAGDAGMTWDSGLHASWMKEVNALPVAYAYDRKQWIAKIKAEKRVIIFTWPGAFPTLQESAPVLRELNWHCILMPTYMKAAKLTPSERGDDLFLPDPRVRKAYMDALEEALKLYGDVIKYVFVGDEFNHFLKRNMNFVWTKKRAEYPLVNEIDADIKKRFGFGKFGFPTQGADDAFEQLAFNRWVADFLEQFYKEVVTRARAIKPDLLFISEDPIDIGSGFATHYFETWKGVFDVASHQAFYAKSIYWQCKLMRDLGGVPHVWPCPHLESLFTTYSPNEITDILSACFMNGADGIHTWPIAARDAMVRPDSVDQPGAIRMLVDYLNLMSRGALPRHGKPQVAVLYSSDTLAAGEWGAGGADGVSEALGLELGCDHKIVGDLGLERGHDRLADYKLLIVPSGSIERRNVVEMILKAVKKGLFLMVMRADAFTSGLDGRSEEDLVRQLLGGGKLVPLPESLKKMPNACFFDTNGIFADCKEKAYTYGGKGLTFSELPPTAQVLARYPDKTTAAVLLSVGKGRVLWMAGVPHHPYVKNNAAIYSCVLKELGIPFDRPSWRIRLPLEFKRVPSKGVYLTGNYYGLEFQIPQIGWNVLLPGSYSYSLAPDAENWASPDGDKNAPPRNVSFAQGRLTDRPRDKRSHVKFSRTEAFTVDFDLSAAVAVKTVDIYCGGTVPDVELLISDDGRAFRRLALLPARGELPITSVECLSLTPADGKPINGRFVRLAFGERPEKKILELAEVDIIGPAQETEK